jgi:hypothetical protein
VLTEHIETGSRSTLNEQQGFAIEIEKHHRKTAASVQKQTEKVSGGLAGWRWCSRGWWSRASWTLLVQCVLFAVGRVSI